MSFPVKSHLPLITTRIQFQFNVLPPPPQITARRDLGARIRRQARHNSVPYSRPKRVHEKTAAVRNVSVGFDLRSESPLSDPPDSESSDGEDNGDLIDTIPKPKGEAGRTNSGGYNLQKALGWEEKQFGDFSEFINNLVVDRLDFKKCYSKQNAADLEEVIQSIAQKFHIKNVYSKDWPIRDALKLRLKYTSDWEKKKVLRKTANNFKKVLEGSKGLEVVDNL